jgi:heat shock protein HslJ
MRTKAALFLVGLAAVLVLAAACGGDGSGDPLAGSTWKMNQLGPAGAPVPAMSLVDVNIEFSADGTTIKGSGGCNSYSGSYTLDGDAFATSNVSWTEIGCTEPQGIFKQEALYFDLMTSAQSFVIRSDELTLKAPGDRLIVFVRAGS